MRRSLASLALVAACAKPAVLAPAAPACPADRKLVLASQDDVARARACTSAASVVVRTGAAVDLAPLVQLATIDGDLVIGPTVGVDELALPNLRTVGGAIRVAANGSLRGLYLPHLERARQIEIDGNVVLTTVSLPRLAAVDGALLVTDNAALEAIDASALVSIGKELAITGAPVLVLVELGRLVKDTGIRLERVPALPEDVRERLGKPAPP